MSLHVSMLGVLTCCKAGSVIKDDPALDVSEIVNGLRTYIESTHDAKTLVQPITQLHSTKPSLEHAEEVNAHHAILFLCGLPCCISGSIAHWQRCKLSAPATSHRRLTAYLSLTWSLLRYLTLHLTFPTFLFRQRSSSIPSLGVMRKSRKRSGLSATSASSMMTYDFQLTRVVHLLIAS